MREVVQLMLTAPAVLASVDRHRQADTTAMDIQEPNSIPELEQLIHRLYQPNPPEVIFRIQEVLQQVQKSSEGWKLAEHLLAGSEPNIRFFGALTVVVKLNTERLVSPPTPASGAHDSNSPH